MRANFVPCHTEDFCCSILTVSFSVQSHLQFECCKQNRIKTQIEMLKKNERTSAIGMMEKTGLLTAI